MAYLIVEKLEDGTNLVHLGPMNWRPNFFQSCLRDDLEINFKVPLSNDTAETVIVSDTVKIIPVRDLGLTSEFNQKTQIAVGPYYNFFDTYAEMYHNIQDKSIDAVKSELKPIVAANRYKYEVMGVTTTIQNKEVFLLTSREDRALYLQAYQLGKDNINWKFGSEFLSLSNSDLGLIVQAVTNHIQAAFDWEASKYQEIDSKQTLEELDAVKLISDNPIWEPVTPEINPPR
jgi:hypothetical protein